MVDQRHFFLHIPPQTATNEFLKVEHNVKNLQVVPHITEL